MTHIEVIALKPFGYSEDGIHGRQIVPHETFPCIERLFHGLNKEGYVRRATIGDGHISLEPAAEGSKEEPAAEAPTISAIVDANIRTVSVASIVSTAAPQPPVRTAELSDEEKAALADGSWKDWRFFKQRSVAAKISDKPILNGEDAKAAIEAYITSQE